MGIDPASNALTTVDRLRAAGFGGSANEDALQMAINAVSAALERECGRTFRQTSFGGPEGPPAELLQGSGRRLLLLSAYPILNVSSVKIDGSEVSDWRLTSDSASWGALYRAAGWPRVEGAWGDLVAEADGEASYNIEVAYTGGFGEVPADLEFAVMQEVEAAAGGASGPGKNVKSERTAGGWAITYADGVRAASVASQRVFEAYRRVAL